MTDYPAAHSMDTEWFAIDKDGHVAHLTSGEHAAVPSTVSNFCDGYNFNSYNGYNDIVQRILDLPASKLKTIKFNAKRLFKDNEHSKTPLLLELDSKKGLKILKSANVKFIELNVVGKTVIYLPGFYRDYSDEKEQAIEELHNHKYCKSCLLTSDRRFYSQFFQQYDFLARFGFYIYDAGEYGSLSIYDRVKIPVSPLHIQQIGEGLINADSIHTFTDIKFANMPTFQPWEHCKDCRQRYWNWTPSITQTGSWYAIDCNGYIANFIGEGYTELYDSYEEIIEDLACLEDSEDSKKTPIQYNFSNKCSYENRWNGIVTKLASEEALTFLKKNDILYEKLSILNALVVYIYQYSTEILDELHSKNYCCGCLPLNKFFDNRAMGIYEYSLRELAEDGMSNVESRTYKRTVVPRKPCKANEVLYPIYRAAQENVLPKVKFKVCKAIPKEQLKHLSQKTMWQ